METSCTTESSHRHSSIQGRTPVTRSKSIIEIMRGLGMFSEVPLTSHHHSESSLPWFFHQQAPRDDSGFHRAKVSDCCGGWCWMVGNGTCSSATTASSCNQWATSPVPIAAGIFLSMADTHSLMTSLPSSPHRPCGFLCFVNALPMFLS